MTTALAGGVAPDAQQVARMVRLSFPELVDELRGALTPDPGRGHRATRITIVTPSLTTEAIWLTLTATTGFGGRGDQPTVDIAAVDDRAAPVGVPEPEAEGWRLAVSGLSR